MRSKMILYFAIEGIVYWGIFFIWQAFPSNFTFWLFILNSLIMTPVGFWMINHLQGEILNNISEKKDLRIEVKGNQRHPLVKYLRQKFLYFFDNATSLSTEAAKLFFFIDRSKSYTKQQTEHSQEINLSLQQMSAVIHQIAESTESSLGKAHISHESAQQGMQQVEENVSVMNRLIESFTSINATMEDLKQSTGKISQVMDVIQGISNQTNMLSLNAAIEAAKAGEQGKGFAVVAEEVRNLAQRTSQSTVEISSLVENIEETTTRIVTELQGGTRQITQGREVALETKQIFNSILKNTKENQSDTKEVAIAVEEQSLTIETISSSMTELSESMNQIYHNIEESASTARNLSVQGEDFMRFLLEYRLGNRASKIVHALKGLQTEVGALLTRAEHQGIPIWDHDYQEVESSTPLKFDVKYLSWIDQSPLQQLQDAFKQQHAVFFTVLVDKNGFLPKHNSEFDHPISGNKEQDLVKSRSRRLFNDFTGKRAGKNTDRLLFQTYVRDTGEVMMDLSVPIMINKKHWGGIRVGFTPES